jgi:Rrf2 family iron-sulfur cluster assembly transcriptional regulator
MRLTTKSRHALTAMLYLAINHEQRRPIPLIELETRQYISLSYLEQLFAQLRQRGLVTGTRGPGGGYRLGRHPAEITVVEVISAVDPTVDAENANAQSELNIKSALSQRLWHDLSSKMYAFLSGINLADVVRQYSYRASEDKSLVHSPTQRVLDSVPSSEGL